MFTLLYFISHVMALAGKAAVGTGRVRLSLCLLITDVYFGKTADSLQMPFRVVLWGPVPSTGMGMGKFWVGKMGWRSVT